MMGEMEELKMIESLQNLSQAIIEKRYYKKEKENYRLKAAYYKALLQGTCDLAEKISKQLTENEDYKIGEFDGFGYSSKRANARFRTLEDMYGCKMITEDEFRFLKEVDL
jgi:hypothetical protein